MPHAIRAQINVQRAMLGVVVREMPAAKNRGGRRVGDRRRVDVAQAVGARGWAEVVEPTDTHRYGFRSARAARRSPSRRVASDVSHASRRNEHASSTPRAARSSTPTGRSASQSSAARNCRGILRGTAERSLRTSAAAVSSRTVRVPVSAGMTSRATSPGVSTDTAVVDAGAVGALDGHHLRRPKCDERRHRGDRALLHPKRLDAPHRRRVQLALGRMGEQRFQQCVRILTRRQRVVAAGRADERRDLL